MWTKITEWAGRNFCVRRLRSRYVLLLEDEVGRLRAENRGLVNSLLGTAGFPPIALEDEVRRGVPAMTAVRRRTWSQIAREREFAAGKSAVVAGKSALSAPGLGANGK
jgi:hypothetical protein